MAKNVEIKVQGNKLIMTVDMTKRFGRSKSGKTIAVASTEGNIAVPGAEHIKIGLNVYTKDGEPGDE